MMPGGKILLMCCNGLLVMTGAYQAGVLAAGVLEQRIIEQEAAPLILPAVATETNTRPRVSTDYTEFAAILDRNIFKAERRPSPPPPPPKTQQNPRPLCGPFSTSESHQGPMGTAQCKYIPRGPDKIKKQNTKRR